MASSRDRYRLPKRLFLYTLDQISDLLQVHDLAPYVHFDGLSIGIHLPDRLLARNIAPSGETPEWRIEEEEFIRWMDHMRIIPLNRAMK